MLSDEKRHAYEQQLHDIGVTSKEEQQKVLDFLVSLVVIVSSKKA
jgi:hypothetical protein